MNDMTAEIQAEIAPVVKQAVAMQVNTPNEYQAASDYLKAVKGAQAKVTAFFAPMKKKAHEAWKSITQTEAETLKPLTQAESLLKGTITTYLIAEEKKRAEEQRKLQAAADEAARVERARLEREAARLKTPELREQRLEAAAAVIAPVVAVATATPSIAGQSVRKTWVAVVTDSAKVPREWLIINDSALQAFARSTKGAATVAGVRFEEKTTLASSSR